MTTLYYESSNELYHHGVKGMKWGRRRYQNPDGSLKAAGKGRYSGGGISGAIRNKQRSNAERDLSDIKKQQRQVDSELRELKGYAKNPTGLANSKISTAIRNKQIRDLEKSKANLKSREKDNRDALRELEEIDRYQAQKRAAKENKKRTKANVEQYGRLEDAYNYKKNPKEKDMLKAYGKIEDSLTYSKYANKKAERYAQKALNEIERQLAQKGKNKSYDLTKVNSFLDKALESIDDDLNP